jgi:hypothetical protein
MVSGGLQIKAHHPWELRHSLARFGIVPPWESRHPLVNCKVFPSGFVGGGLKIEAHHPWGWNTPLRGLEQSPCHCELRYPLAGVLMFPPFGVVGGGLKIKARHPTWTLMLSPGGGRLPLWEDSPCGKTPPALRLVGS